jgi:hypothetical protein
MQFFHAGWAGVRANPWIALQHCCKCLIAEAKCLTGWGQKSTGYPIFSTGRVLLSRPVLSLYLFDFKKRESKEGAESASTGCPHFSTGLINVRTVIHGLALRFSADPWNPWIAFPR